MTAENDIKHTPLDALHRELGARMVPFAGYSMPVQYPLGILKEHLHTREKAGLFDVSHMGQVRIAGEDAATMLETLVPGEIQGLKAGRIRYTQFTNDQGGILDDLMVTRAADGLYLVVNAACKEQDIAHLQALFGDRLEVLEDLALLALQGPASAEVLSRLGGEVADMPFMSAREVTIAGTACFVSRSGYTGEDGFEISVASREVEALARALLADEDVEPIGLGARDSLRLEAGLCLYGHDIDSSATPIEAGLIWSISKRRRAEGGFPGASIVQRQIEEGVSRKRVGIQPEGRAPAREGTEIADADGKIIGNVTSGGFGATIGGPVAMGYVETAFADVGTEVSLLVRGKSLPAKVAALPFITPGYKR